MSGKKENTITKQIAEWLKTYDQDKIAYFFAHMRGQVLGETYDRREMTFVCYNGIKGTKEMSLEELIEEIESDFANFLEEPEDSEHFDWEKFVVFMNKNLPSA